MVSPSLEFEENTASAFTSSLPNPIVLSNLWSVGLRDITFPNSFKNLPTEENEIHILLFDDDDANNITKRILIKIPNIKATSKNFITYLNSKISISNPDLVHFELNAEGFVTIKSKEKLLVFLTAHLAYLLGFETPATPIETFWLSKKLVKGDFLKPPTK